MSEFWHAIEASDAVRRLGWGLLHSVWLGAAVAGLLASANRVTRRRSADARYATACVALVAVVALSASAYFFAPVRPRPATAGLGPQPVGRHAPAAPQARPPIADVSPEATAMPSIPDAVSTVAPAGGGATRATPAAPPPAPPAPAPPRRPPFRARVLPDVEPALPWLAAAWAVGVVALALWQCGGWAAARRIRARAVRPDSGLSAEAVKRLARAMNVRGRVEVLESALVSVPTLIGWLGPAILLPVGLASGLTAAQLRAILAHELAHVRRHDYLVNLLQSLAETLLFYHPAVWYISARIRAEREHCCDDLVVAHGTEPAEYAESLLCVARRALAARGVAALPAAVALAAAGRPSELRRRVRRLLGAGGADPAARAARRWPAGVAAILAVGGVVALLHPGLRSNTSRAADPGPRAAAAPGTAPASRPAAPRPPAWGEAKEGLRTRLSAGKQVFRAGESIPVKLEVENVGGQARDYQTPAAPHNHALVVVDERGRAVPYLGGLSQVAVRTRALGPGELHEMKSFDLAESYYLRRPGRYSVFWPGELVLWRDPGAAGPPPVSPASAPFEFDVVADPALAAADGDPVGRLLPLVKDQWWLGGGPSRPATLRPGGNRGEVDGRLMTMLYSPTLSKKDSGLVWLWLTDEAAAEQPVASEWPPASEYLGKIDRWHVYVRVEENARKAWPAAKEDIKRALAAEPKPPTSRPAALNAPGWGEPVNGLRTRFAVEKQSYEAGEPVYLKLEVRNVTDQARDCLVKPAATVVDERGRPAPYLAGTADFGESAGRLAAGEWRGLPALDLSEWYYLRRPGRYSVRWTGGPAAADFDFDVTPNPAMATADGDPVGRLLPLVKAGWVIGAGPDGVTFEPGSNWGRTTGRAVRFVLNPPLHRHDSAAVWLWLAEQAAPARAADTDSSLPRSEYLGKISRWHVYFLASANALEAWPAAKEDVARALNEEAAAPPGGRRAAQDARDAQDDDDDGYRALHDRYKAEVRDAARAGKKEELSALTDKFNDSLAGKLLYAQVVSRVGPIDRHITLLSKSFGDRKISVGKIHFAAADKPHVERNADGAGYVLIATNPLEGGKWPDGLQITLVVEPAAPRDAGAATRPAARPKLSLKMNSDRPGLAPGEDVVLTITVTNLTADTLPAPETYWSARLVLDGKEYKRLPEFVGDWNGPAGIIPGGDFRTNLSLSEYGVPPAALAAGEHKASVRVAGDESDVLNFAVREPAAPAGGGRPGAAAPAPAGVPVVPAGGQQQRELRGPVTEIHPTMLENKVWVDLKGRLAGSEHGYAYVSVDANGTCRLSLASTATRDLSHLNGALLESLDLSNTAVDDLSPLAGMPLRVLDVSGSRVRDLSPLKGMKLKTLRLSNTRVDDLSPLKDADLTEVDAASTPVADLSALARMPLAYLDVRRTAVKDLSPLAGTPLATLQIEDTEVADLRPLRKTRLGTLTLGGRKGPDLSQLDGVPLTSMTLSGTEVTDLSPLRGMKLESLQLVDTGVKDLTPVADMPLRHLSLSGTPVSDLTPLKGMRLTELYLSEPKADLAPLAGMPLETVGLPDVSTVANIETLRGIKTLRSIRPPAGKPLSAAEFWKLYDAGKLRGADAADPPAGRRAAGQ